MTFAYLAAILAEQKLTSVLLTEEPSNLSASLFGISSLSV